MDKEVWLAADYHLPITYSCRMPMSSPHSAKALAAPGPATVRLALIRVSIELYGLEQTKNIVFPVVRSAEIKIRPPKMVSLSPHLLRAYKANDAGYLEESPTYREFAHATGATTVYVRIPESFASTFEDLLSAVGYWGHASSFAQCLSVYKL